MATVFSATPNTLVCHLLYIRLQKGGLVKLEETGAQAWLPTVSDYLSVSWELSSSTYSKPNNERLYVSTHYEDLIP